MAFLKLYEVKNKILDAIDEESGEILISEEDFDNLIKAEEDGLEYFLKLYKNAFATVKALKEEKKNVDDNFTSRIKAAEYIANHASYVIEKYLEGNKYESATAKVSYRKSTKCEAEDMDAFMKWDGRIGYLRYSDPEPALDDIKTAIKNGEEIPGFKNVDYINMSIK